MCSPAPPAAPNYEAAAQAQGQSNVQAARTTSQLNNPNVINPYGTQTVQYGSPFDEAGYNKAYNDYETAQANFNPWTWWEDENKYVPTPGAPVAPEKSAFMGNQDIPTITQTFSPEQQALFEQSNRVKGLLGGLGEQGATSLQGVVGKPVDFSGNLGDQEATRQRVFDAMMGRVNEDYGRTRDQANSDLVAAGIRPGSTAYGDRMQMLERGLTDARQQATLGSEAAGMDRRKQEIAEMLAQRQVPLNEIAALMSGSQVQNPFATPGYAQGAQVGAAPTYGAANALGQYGTDVFNVRGAQQGNLQSGLFGLGASGLAAYGMGGFSDRRLKSNIQRIGTHPLGIGLYRYELFGRPEIGLMADEVLTVRPEAVFTHPSGYLMVDYGRLHG